MEREAPPRRQHTKFDRYAIFDLGREYHLPGPELWVLTGMVLLADFRSAELTTTATELAQQLRVSGKTLRKHINHFKELELVEEVEPFRGNACGVLRLPAYATLVVPERRGAAARSGDRGIPTSTNTPRTTTTSPRYSDTISEPTAKQAGTSAEFTCENDAPGGREAAREGGELQSPSQANVEGEDLYRPCVSCLEPSDRMINGKRWCAGCAPFEDTGGCISKLVYAETCDSAQPLRREVLGAWTSDASCIADDLGAWTSDDARQDRPGITANDESPSK
jgi:hypothetical protein